MMIIQSRILFYAHDVSARPHTLHCTAHIGHSSLRSLVAQIKTAFFPGLRRVFGARARPVFDRILTPSVAGVNRARPANLIASPHLYKAYARYVHAHPLAPLELRTLHVEVSIPHDDDDDDELARLTHCFSVMSRAVT